MKNIFATFSTNPDPGTPYTPLVEVCKCTSLYIPTVRNHGTYHVPVQIVSSGVQHIPI